MAIIDPATGGRLTFLDSGEDDVLVVEWAVPAGWTAGPSHRHPGQAETLRPLARIFEARVRGRIQRLAAGDEIVVDPGVGSACRAKLRTVAPFGPSFVRRSEPSRC